MNVVLVTSKSILMFVETLKRYQLYTNSCHTTFTRGCRTYWEGKIYPSPFLAFLDRKIVEIYSKRLGFLHI